MVITLKPGTTEKGIQHVLDKIKELGFTPHVSKGAERTIIGVIGENAIRSREIFEAMFIVESVMPISQPYKLVSRGFKSEDTVVKVEDVEIGGKEVVVMAGPCAVESRAQLLKVAQEVKEAGARILRGGAFKPRTSPYSFQGLGEESLNLPSLSWYPLISPEIGPPFQIKFPVVSDTTSFYLSMSPEPHENWSPEEYLAS